MTKSDDDVVRLAPGEYIDKHGKKRRRLGTVPRCECCGAKAKVLMEIGKYRDDWIMKDCDNCSGYVCNNCCDTDDDGHVTCLDCLATTARRENR